MRFLNKIFKNKKPSNAHVLTEIPILIPEIKTD